MKVKTFINRRLQREGSEIALLLLLAALLSGLFFGLWAIAQVLWGSR